MSDRRRLVRATRVAGALLTPILLFLLAPRIPDAVCAPPSPRLAARTARPDSLPARGPAQEEGKADDLWSEGFRYDAGPDGSVRAELEFEGQLVAVGSFTHIGDVPLNHVARWDGTAWRPMGEGPPTAPWALAVLNGQLFAGAYRWDGETWTNVLQTDAAIYALVVQGGSLFATGRFTQAAGGPADRILRWDGAAVNAVGAGLDDEAYALAADDQGIYVGGRFTQAGGAPALRIARWDGTAWSPVGGGVGAASASPGYTPRVDAIAVYAGQVVAGGMFATAGDDTIQSLAAWDGTAWHPLGSGLRDIVCTMDMGMDTECWSPYVRALRVSGDELLACGSFWRIGGQEAVNIAAWDGQAWHPIGAGLGAGNYESDFPTEVSQIGVFGDQIFASGLFGNSGRESLGGFAVWDGSAWSRPYPLGLGLDGEARAILEDGDRLIVAGSFAHASNLLVDGIATFDGERWAQFSAPGVADGLYATDIRALARWGGDLVSVGWFDNIGGVAARNVALWDGSAWQPMGDGVPEQLASVAVHDGSVYVGTGADYAPGLAYVYRWDGVTWQREVTVGKWARVLALASYGGKLVLAGPFSTANGDSMRNICSWDGSTCRPLGGGIGGWSVRCLAVQGEDLLAGGGFYTAGGTRTNYIARWDGTAWSALGTGMTGGNSDYGVFDLRVRGDQVFAVGNFTTAGDQPASRVAMWNGREWRGFGAGIDAGYNRSWVYAAAIMNGDLYVGGTFLSAGTRVADNFARWREPRLPVRFSGFAATREGPAARLSWQVAGPTAGTTLHVWRQDSGRPRIRLTTAALAAAANGDFHDPLAPTGTADYWLQELAADGTESWLGPAHLPAAAIPTALRLAPNQPNPFNPRTTIAYSLPLATPVTLAVYDQRGRLVRTLVHGTVPAGEQAVAWDGRDEAGRPAASGAYVVRLVTDTGRLARKITLAR